jgi:biotin carboxyl carrier protein
MAVTGRGVRVTIGDRSWDLEEGTDAGDVRVTGPGIAVVTPPDGVPRRIVWEHLGGATRGPAHVRDGDATATHLELIVDGWRFEARVEDLGRARLRERARRDETSSAVRGPLVVVAPIPGRISSVRVAEGESVEAGAPLVTLDAMKMENIVRAPRAGTIGRVAVAADQTVELGDTLLELA